MRRTLIFIAGTKGGVGKSFAALMLAGAAMDLGLSLNVYDTDNENRTLSTLMPDQSEFLDEVKEQYPLDAVINGLFAEPRAELAIVDMKAGTSRTTQQWFSSVPWDALLDTDVDVYVVGCITSDPDSVRTFVPWLDYFRHIDFPVSFVIVKNSKDGDRFFTCASLLEPAMDKLKLNYQIFDFPAVEQEYINELNNNNLTLRSHLNGEGNSGVLPTVMQRSRLRKHYCAITDPLVEFFAARFSPEDMNESRSRKIQHVRKRISSRKKMEATNKTNRKT